MRFSLLQLFFVGLFAPITVTAYDCLKLPNVYTKEDLNDIKAHCETADVLGSEIYPSATWIIHAYLDRYYTWIGTIKTDEQKTGTKQLRQICIITLGGKNGYGKLHRLTFTNVSGNCGESYPVNYANLYNFIDIGVESAHEVCKGCYKENKEYKYWRIEDGKEVLSNDNEPNALNIWGDMRSPSMKTKPALEADVSKRFEHMNLPINPDNGKVNICPAWQVKASNLNTCTSIVGPIVYKEGFYGMDKLPYDKRPYHHGCFTAEKVPFTDLSFLKDLTTGSDYVDRCIGKFANVVRNSRSLCPDPKTYYAYMDPDPESEIRTAYLNSEFNKKGEFYVKMEFPEGINYDCVNKCTGDITDDNVNDLREGKYGYACKTITGIVTLIKPQWKDPQTNTVMGEIREIIGKLTIFAEVDRNVLPNLRTIHSEADGPALELTITDEDEFEPILPMRLTKITSNGEHSIELKHSMDKARIPQRLMDDLKRIAGSEQKIKYTPV